MNTINVNAIPNSYLEGEIDSRRGHAMRSYFKRQSRRQIRHRLAAELREQMEHHLAEAVEMKSMRVGVAHHSPNVASSATILTFPDQAQRAARAVQVTRRLAGTPFVRKQVRVELLAA